MEKLKPQYIYIYHKSNHEKEKTKTRRRYLNQRATGVRSNSQKVRGHGDFEEDLSEESLTRKVLDLQATIKVNVRTADPNIQVKAKTLIQEVKLSCGDASAKELEQIIGVGKETKHAVFINQYEEREKWKKYRENLLTASNFSKVISKKRKTSNKSDVDQIVYARDISDHPEHETIAINELKEEESHVIIPTVNTYPHLAATTDGLIYDKTKKEG